MNDEYLKKLSAEIESTIPDDCIYYSNPYDSDAILYAVQKAWQSACEYKQKEIDELLGQLKSCIFVYEEKLDRLISENKKLRDALEFYAEYKNDDPDDDYNYDVAIEALKEKK